MSLTIGGIEVVPQLHIQPSGCRFAVEISNAHNGSFDRAIRLIDAAKATGGDFVKFQAFTVDELCALRGEGPAPSPWGDNGRTVRDLYTQAETPLAWMPGLFQHARDIGIVPFASVFGLESLAALEKCAAPAYKIARLDAKHRGLVDAVLSRGKPVLVSEDPADCFTIGYTGGEVHRLACPAGYPVAAKDMRLPNFHYGYKGPGYVGLSSHCLHPDLPIAAVARGCSLIEMHMMLEAEPSVLESNVSLTEVQFTEMIRRVREVETMLA